MPIHVNIPTRLKLDSTAVFTRPDSIQEALGLAAFRALRNSKDIVIEERGGYLDPCLHEPEFVWLGPGLNEVPLPLRTDLEERVRTTLSLAADEAGVFQWRRKAERAPSPMPDRIQERLDSERYSGLLARYNVPSYDDPTDTENLPVGTVTVIEDVDIRQFAGWRVIGDRNWWRDRRLFESALNFSQGVFGNLPSAPPWGMLWRTPQGWGVLIQKPAGYSFFDFPRFVVLRLVGTTRLNETVGRVSEVPEPDRGSARYLTRSQIVEILRANIQSVLRRHARADEGVGENELTLQIEVKAEDLLATMTPGPEIACGVEIQVGSTATIILFDSDLPFSGVVPLLPIVEFVVPGEEGTEEDGGSGGEGRDSQQGPGAGARRGTGTGTGEGAGAGAGSQRRGIVFTGTFAGSEPAARGTLFPSVPVQDGVQLRCQPFDSEPPVTAMGPEGQELWRQILEITNDLDMDGCIYPGRFCLHAALTLQSRAADVGDYAALSNTPPAFIRPVVAERGAVGLFEFVPSDPPAMQYMTHLARVTSKIGRLSRSLTSVMDRPGIAAQFESPTAFWWKGYFAQEFRPLMRRSVAILFAMACRVYMLQLLESSRQAIAQRQQHIDAYAAVFEQLLQILITDIHKLHDLRRQLDEVQPRGVFESLGRGAYNTWREARSALTEAFAPPVIGASGGVRGEVVYEGERAIGIRDEEGRLWTRAALESALSIKQNSAIAIDPLVNQIAEDQDLRRRFTAAGANIRSELDRLLQEMSDENAKIRRKVASDWEFAYKASSIHRDYRSATIPGSAYALTGIHAQVHERLGEFFQGDPFYASGVDLLLAVESGRQSIIAWLEFGTIIVLAVFCAPAAFLVGIATAIYHHREALERAAVFRALIDPEQVLTRAEVEAGLFATELALVLTFIPEVGTILKAGTAGVKSFARAGAAGGARLLVRYLRGRLSRQLVRQMSRGILKGFAHEIVEDQIEDFILNKVLLDPALDQLYREFRLTEAVPELIEAGAAEAAADVEQARQSVDQTLEEE